MSSELLTHTEFARRVGCARQRIGQLVGEGKLPAVPGPRNTRLIPWAEGRLAWQMHRGMADATTATVDVASSVSGGIDDLDALEAATASASTANIALSSAALLAAAKARKEAARARLAELDLAERQSDLIPVDEVRADAVTVMASVRATLLALPSKVGLMCEGKTAAEVEAVISDQINVLLSEWHKGRFGSP